MEQSDHDAFVEAERYGEWLLKVLEADMDAIEISYLRYQEAVLNTMHLLTSAEELIDGSS